MTFPLPPAVTFDYAAWQAMFPDFANVSSAYATSCFTRATFLCQNNAANPVVSRSFGDTTQLTYFLNLLTAHICWLNAPQVNGIPNTTGGASPSPLVGRVSQASEGTVSVSTDLGAGNMPQGMAYYAQTKWGLEYWQASAGYRQGPYIPGVGPSRWGVPGGFGPFGAPAFRRRVY